MRDWNDSHDDAEADQVTPRRPGSFRSALRDLPNTVSRDRSLRAERFRLHGIGKSAWAVLFLLPVIGPIVLTVYAVHPSEPCANLYD